MATPQIFDPSTVSPEQMAGLVNVPGQSLTATNPGSAIAAAQALNPNPNIPAYKVAPTDPFYVPPGYKAEDYNAILAGTNTANANIDKTTADLASAKKSLGNASADEAALEDKFGVDANKKIINDLQASLNSLNNEARAETVKIDNQPILSSIAQGQAGQVEKLRAIKAMSISAQIQATQGNITLALDQVDRAIKLKYDPIKAEIEALNTQLDRNYERLTSAEKKEADALKAKNDERLRLLKVEEDKEKDTKDTLLNQMQAYPDAKITLNDTLESANTKITQNSKIYADKVRPPVGAAGSGSGSTGFKNTGIESSVREDAVTLLDEVDAGDTTIEKAYKKLRTLYSPAEASDASIKALLGIVDQPKKKVDPAAEAAAAIEAATPKRTEVTGEKEGAIGAINRVGVGISNWFKGL